MLSQPKYYQLKLQLNYMKRSANIVVTIIPSQAYQPF